jgi:hypothetical protein
MIVGTCVSVWADSGARLGGRGEEDEVAGGGLLLHEAGDPAVAAETIGILSLD